MLTIYFYHTRLTRESYEEWKEYKFPGHILYGLPLLENYGIHSVMHKCKYFSGRLKLMLYATKEILFCKEKYDVLYATSFRGIEPVIFLRAMENYILNAIGNQHFEQDFLCSSGMDTYYFIFFT